MLIAAIIVVVLIAAIVNDAADGDFSLPILDQLQTQLAGVDPYNPQPGQGIPGN
jgi:hypothetical protein